MLPSTPFKKDYLMIDFISIAKPNLEGKVNPFFGYCQKMGTNYLSGTERYQLNGCERIEILWNPESSLQIRGSVMYFWQGHNFTYSHASFIEAINHIGKLIHVDLWDCYVKVFEYGVIMPVELKPKDYIMNHKAKPHEGLNQSINEKDRGNLSRWTDSNVSLKMYDAGRNIKLKQGMNRRETIKKAGWNPEQQFLKFEAHYLKPSVLNHGQGVLLADLVNPDWQDIFKEDLYIQYKRLIPMSNVLLPKNKAELSTASIILIALAEDSLNESKTLQEVKKMLYNRINSIPDSILSKSDKDSRKKQIKSILGKMREADTSKWDLSNKLAEVLENNPDNSPLVQDSG